MSRRRNRSSSKNQKSFGKSIIYIGILLVAAAGAGWYFFYEYGFREDYNHFVQELNEGFKDDDSQVIKKNIKKLEDLKLANSGNSKRLELINDNLLRGYSHFASTHDLTLEEQLVYLRKMYKISPDSLTEQQKKLLSLKK